jgi:hypothetical protein
MHLVDPAGGAWGRAPLFFLLIALTLSLPACGGPPATTAAPVVGATAVLLTPTAQAAPPFSVTSLPLFDAGDGKPTSRIEMLPLEGRVSGSLADPDEAHNWLFEATAGQAVVLQAAAQNGCDPRLRLLGPDGALIGENDNGLDGRGARLTAALPSDGLYTVRVDAWSGGGYTLTLSQTAGPVYTGGDGKSTVSLQTITVGERQTSILYGLLGADNWLFDGAAGQGVVIRLEAGSDSLPEAVLFDPAGNRLAGGENNTVGDAAVIAASLPADGVYTVRVSLWPEGAYALSVEQAPGPVYTGGDSFATTAIESITIGQAVNGRIDSVFQAHNWLFDGLAGQTVTIRVDGEGRCDPRATLIGPDGQVIARDDDNGGGRNALIMVNLPANGMYTVRVDVWVEGDYTLLIR